MIVIRTINYVSLNPALLNIGFLLSITGKELSDFISYVILTLRLYPLTGLFTYYMF